MQDHELVAAIVAGDPGGLAEAYDRYAAALYAYCRFMLPDPRPPAAAADAVADTFIVAAAKLPGLRDPDQLRPWLHAVARNECLRQLGPVAPAGAAGLDDAIPEVSLPADLRERVLAEGADNTPAGRARRVSVAHRAGPFGVLSAPSVSTRSRRSAGRLASGIVSSGAVLAAPPTTATAPTGRTALAGAAGPRWRRHSFRATACIQARS